MGGPREMRIVRRIRYRIVGHNLGTVDGVRGVSKGRQPLRAAPHPRRRALFATKELREFGLADQGGSLFRIERSSKGINVVPLLLCV